MIIVHAPFISPRAMALWPFILFKHKQEVTDPVLINHERIHLRQQLELFILPFYLLYAGCYLFHLFRYRDHTRAYLHICFEREAYSMDTDRDYLKRRRAYAALTGSYLTQ